MNAEDSKTEVFDVFLCHNSEDKPAVREIAQELSREKIKPWLDEADIKAGSFWDITIGQQIETVKAAAVFVGQHGLGPWQRREIIALLDQFDTRGCPVIPVILESAPLNHLPGLQVAKAMAAQISDPGQLRRERRNTGSGNEQGGKIFLIPKGGTGRNRIAFL